MKLSLMKSADPWPCISLWPGTALPIFVIIATVWTSWKGCSIQMFFGQAEGIWLQATSIQRTCSCSPVNRYQCFIEIALLCIDFHFPLSGIYWELHSFHYSRDTCYLCAFAITPIIVKTLHTFFQFDFASAFPNLQVSSLRAQGSSPWLVLLPARPDEKCVHYKYWSFGIRKD